MQQKFQNIERQNANFKITKDKTSISKYRRQNANFKMSNGKIPISKFIMQNATLRYFYLVSNPPLIKTLIIRLLKYHC